MQYKNIPNGIVDIFSASRAFGILKSSQSAPERSIWIEWKPYETEVDSEKDAVVPREDNIRPVRELVAPL